MAKRIFSVSEQRVIKALIQLDRWATANEVAEWADGLSWNTANSVLKRLYLQRIVERKKQGKNYLWRLRNFDGN
jgi:predicted transcriptional regulator